MRPRGRFHHRHHRSGNAQTLKSPYFSRKSANFLRAPPATATSGLQDLQEHDTSRHRCNANTPADDRVVKSKPYVSVTFCSNPQAQSAAQGAGALYSLSDAESSLISDSNEEEKRKQKAVTWELACALAYAYLHQQQRPFQAVHAVYAEAYNPCMKALCSISRPPLPDIVNPTQAAQWLEDRSLPLGTY